MLSSGACPVIDHTLAFLSLSVYPDTANKTISSQIERGVPPSCKLSKPRTLPLSPHLTMENMRLRRPLSATLLPRSSGNFVSPNIAVESFLTVDTSCKKSHFNRLRNLTWRNRLNQIRYHRPMQRDALKAHADYQDALRYLRTMRLLLLECTFRSEMIERSRKVKK